MRQILSDIRALAGVTGVAVIAKRTGKVDHLFPAAFTERHTQFLRELITSTYQRLRGFTRLALRFERVVVHLYNQPEYLLFVTVLPDTDTRQFEMVVNSKFAAITRSIGQPAATATVVSGSRPAAATTAKANGEDPVLRLIMICNSLTDQVADSRGRVQLANIWRKARDIALQNDPSFASLMIDAAGRLNLRKGNSMSPSATTMSAFAVMIQSFLDELGTQKTLAEEELFMLLKPHRALFEPTGLFMYLGHVQGARA